MHDTVGELIKSFTRFKIKPGLRFCGYSFSVALTGSLIAVILTYLDISQLSNLVR